MPVISIITVCYNAADDLRKTLASVAQQTYPHVQQVVVDGASTDHTPSVMAEYAELIGVALSEPDRGIYDAMNKGLALATGEYLCFLNAGDTFHSPDTLDQVMSQVMSSSTRPDVLYGDTDIVDEQGKFLHKREHRPPRKLTARSFLRGMLVCHQSFYVRRAIAPQYDLRYRFSADVDWCIRILKQAREVHNTQLTLTDYLHEGATTRNHRASLIERWHILHRHFGLVAVVGAHLFFALRLVKRTIEKVSVD